MKELVSPKIRGISLKSLAEIEKLRVANRMVAEIHALLKPLLVPGVSTGELDRFVEEEILRRGAKPAFKGYQGRGRVPFPGSICASINEEVVHGIPSFKRKLRAGDEISIDIGLQYDQFYGDMAVTYVLPPVRDNVRRLIEATQGALVHGIEAAREGNRISDIGHAIQSFAGKHGYGVVRDFVGHGIGRSLHEEPQVPNFREAGMDVPVTPGMVLAIEPMLNEGSEHVVVLRDGWTVVTRDRRLSAHFEHIVAVGEHATEVLSRVEGDWLSAWQEDPTRAFAAVRATEEDAASRQRSP